MRRKKEYHDIASYNTIYFLRIPIALKQLFLPSPPDARDRDNPAVPVAAARGGRWGLRPPDAVPHLQEGGAAV